MSTAAPLRAVTVVGGGLAGFTVARELRSRGFDGAVRLVDPQGLPYDRPPLSKAYLAGRADRSSLRLAPPEWYSENAVELVEDRVTSLRPDRATVTLAGGSDLAADAVVLATGGRPRPLPVPGGDLPGVVSLRDRDDADALRAALGPGCRLVVVGAGLIGAEVASTAVGGGADVVVIDPLPAPLVPAVGEELAEELHAMHSRNGVQVLTGTPTRVTADGAALLVDVERQSGIRRVVADVVLSAIGIEVDTSLADGAGLATDGGIVVGAGGATSNPAVRAAGDGIRRLRPDGTPGRRSEHWEAALQSGTEAACGLLGVEPPDRTPPWFWTDRYGVHVEAVGSMSAPGTTVLRQEPDGRRAAFRVATDGTLVGCAVIDAGKVLRAAKRLIARRTEVALDELTDPAVDLRTIGKRTTAGR